MTDENAPPDEHGGWFLPVWAVLILGVIVVGCAVFSIPVFNALYGIVFPPSPPIPEAIQTEKIVIEHGVEKATYTTALNPCQTVQFFITEGGICEVLWDVCVGDDFTNMNRSFIPFAQCEGVSPAGAFAVQWQVDIDLLYPPEQTVFTISHEVLWGGMPIPTSTPAIPD
ncbi:MAG: hypothetical protein MUE54_14715 [Anaerolineae bacterium]|nr:hypothetical protein [Anaerolineae bacterium]